LTPLSMLATGFARPLFRNATLEGLKRALTKKRLFGKCKKFFWKCLKVIQKFRRKFAPPHFWSSGSASACTYSL